jgi:KDO2-lipid IV(A) lauroyltransferase
MSDLFRRFVRYPLEAVAVFSAYAAFRVLPIDAASAAGGWVGRTFGPLLPVTRRARRNLARAMPELPAAEVDRIVRAMWEHLGRVFAELPRIEHIARSRVELINGEAFDCLRGERRSGIIFSGHIGNWELAPHVMEDHGVGSALVYRMPNNPIVANLLRRARRRPHELQLAKGSAGARGALETLRSGRHLSLLIDQKMNDGIPVPFFGRDAMTAPGMAQLALRFECPIVPLRVERLSGCHFRVSVYPPLQVHATGDRAADVRSIATAANALLESWIRERPEQWLWVHRRWPD